MIIILPDAGTYICTADNGVGPPVTAIITCHVICECHHRHHRHHRHHLHHHHHYVITVNNSFDFQCDISPPWFCAISLSHNLTQRNPLFTTRKIFLFSSKGQFPNEIIWFLFRNNKLCFYLPGKSWLQFGNPIKITKK